MCLQGPQRYGVGAEGGGGRGRGRLGPSGGRFGGPELGGRGPGRRPGPGERGGRPHYVTLQEEEQGWAYAGRSGSGGSGLPAQQQQQYGGGSGGGGGMQSQQHGPAAGVAASQFAGGMPGIDMAGYGGAGGMGAAAQMASFAGVLVAACVGPPPAVEKGPALSVAEGMDRSGGGVSM